jgi:hypothetical protein
VAGFAVCWVGRLAFGVLAVEVEVVAVAQDNHAVSLDIVRPLRPYAPTGRAGVGAIEPLVRGAPRSVELQRGNERLRAIWPCAFVRGGVSQCKEPPRLDLPIPDTEGAPPSSEALRTLRTNAPSRNGLAAGPPRLDSERRSCLDLVTRIADLAAATGLSEHYCSLIRLGKRRPHPRHWDALRSVVLPMQHNPGIAQDRRTRSNHAHS